MANDLMTLDELNAIMPKKVTGNAGVALLDEVNRAITDPHFYKEYRDNLVSYTSVLQEGRFKAEDYLAAVKYVTYRLMGKSGFESYIKTFPARYKQMIDNNTPTNTISAYASMYKNNKLVNLVYAQTMIPIYVLNMDLRQEALNTQAELMRSANSEKVRSDAAANILLHLKPPEVTKIELDVGVKGDSTLDSLREATAALVAQQRLQLNAGMVSAKQVAESQIIQGECVEVT